jgi:hypothetical protein
MIRAIRNVAALHLVGNALLLWLGYYWLGTSESRAGTLLWSAFVALVGLTLACWLHAGTLVYFGEGRGAFRRTLRRFLPVLAAAFVLIAIYVLLAKWEAYSMRPASGVASWLTMKLRKPVKPATMLGVFNAALWLVQYVVVPVFALPLIAGLASRGWSGLQQFGRLAKSWQYWMLTTVLMWCAFAAPWKLLGWVPRAGSFSMEMVSFAARLLAAYLLFHGAWLTLLFFSQSKTAGKP